MVFIWPSLALSWPPQPPVSLPRPAGIRIRPGLDQFSTRFFSGDLQKSFWAFLGPKLASYSLGTVIERSGSKFCPVLVLITSQSDFVVRFYDQITFEQSRFLLVCSTSLHHSCGNSKRSSSSSHSKHAP